MYITFAVLPHNFSDSSLVLIVTRLFCCCCLYFVCFQQKVISIIWEWRLCLRLQIQQSGKWKKNNNNNNGVYIQKTTDHFVRIAYQDIRWARAVHLLEIIDWLTGQQQCLYQCLYSLTERPIALFCDEWKMNLLYGASNMKYSTCKYCSEIREWWKGCRCSVQFNFHLDKIRFVE